MGSILLRGKTVLVTRPRNQSEDLTGHLEAAGATVVHCPTIEVLPPNNWAQLDASIHTIKEYDWVVFTSPNGVTAFFDLFFKLYDDARALGSARIAAIGPGTAKRAQR